MSMTISIGWQRGHTSMEYAVGAKTLKMGFIENLDMEIIVQLS